MNKKLKTLLAALLVFVMLFAFAACANDGKSAYEIAVDNGFVGTEQEWLESLKGEYAGQGLSAYEIAVKNGFEGTETQWLESLKGEKGDAVDDGFEAAISQSLFSVVSIQASIGLKNSLGSGVIISDDKDSGTAYIVTNYHVVYSNGISSNIKVFLYGLEDSKYAISASYVGGSMTNDIALLKIQNSDVYKNSNSKPAEFDTSAVNVGQPVAAIGNPEGEGIAATKGIVSVDSEEIKITLADEATVGTLRCIRIDASVNSGNSGGGLFDADGKLIGIVSAKNGESGVEGMGFAIPSSVVYGIVQNIMAQEATSTTSVSVEKCVLGIFISISDSSAYYDEESQSAVIRETVTVASVTSGSASDGKLKKGDVLVSIRINGQLYAIDRSYVLSDLLFLCEVGDTVEINFTRNGVAMSTNITFTQTQTIL